jgi:hypothetical protein
MKTKLCRLLVCVLCLSGFCAFADVLKVGDKIPAITAKDQHDVPYVFTNGTAYLLFALDMDSAKAANHKLADAGAGFLEQHGAAYLMDVHTMPAIAKFFAIPKMQKYPERIVLIDTEHTLDWVPAKPGSLTVLKLTPEARIEKISYWQSTSESVTNLFQ